MFLLVVSPIVPVLPRKVQLIVSLFVNFWATELVTRYYGGSHLYIDEPKTEFGVRDIPLTNDLVTLFEAQRKFQIENGRKSKAVIDGYHDFIFTTKEGNPFCHTSVTDVLFGITRAHNKAEERAARLEARAPQLLPRISAHTLRHTGCTRMAEAGMDPKVLQSIMGHARIGITMDVYNHVDDRRKKRESARMEGTLQNWCKAVE